MTPLRVVVSRLVTLFSRRRRLLDKPVVVHEHEFLI